MFTSKNFSTRTQRGGGGTYDSGSKPDFYFGMWSDIIFRTIDAPEELMTLYRENFEPLEKRFDNTTRANVIKKFFDKVGDTETLPSAYFQSRLGDIGRSIKATFELATAAYDKVQKLSLRDDERPIKISVMTTLADVFAKFRRHTDEIPLREEIVAECESYYPDKRDDRIISAKKSLADALRYGDRQNDALEIRRQIFELFDERDGKKFIDAAKSLAEALEINYDYKAALTIRRKILDVCENAHDDERVVYYRRYFELCEKIGREIFTLDIKNFAETLKKLGRDEEAEQLFEEVEAYYRKNLPTSREDFVSTLRRHAEFFRDIKNYSAAVEKYTEAIDLLEKYSE